MQNRAGALIRFMLSLWIVTGISSGCVPAVTPPQLDFTPGAPVIVAGNHLTLDGFQVTVPPDWRVITGAAESSPSVLIVEPDQTGIILIAPGIQVPPPEFAAVAEARRQTVQRQVILKQTTVTLWLVTDQTYLEALTAVLQDMADSIQDVPRS